MTSPETATGEVLDNGEIARAEEDNGGRYVITADFRGEKVRIIVPTAGDATRLLFRRVAVVLLPD